MLRQWYFRALGAVHLIAFLSLGVQIRGLVGEQGILPIASYLKLAAERLGGEAYWKLPTLCWFDASDTTLMGLCVAGIVLSVLLIVGVAPRLVLVCLWTVYLSLCIAGQAFLSFQWDTLLLETTLCSILYAPRGWWPSWREARPPHLIAKLLLWGLAFKLMFLSGATKVLSGDPSWINGTALNFHYYTQPIPNFVSWHVHHWPNAVQHGSLLLLLFVELVLPWLVFAGRWGRAVFAVGTMLLMVLIEATGNYGFFNLLTAVICLPLLDDDVVRCCARLCRVGCAHQNDVKIGGHSPPYEETVSAKWRFITANVIGGAILFISLLSFVEELAHTQRASRMPAVIARTLDFADRALLSWGEPWILDRVAPFRTINGYGLFRVMTTHRPEVVIEYTHDGETWREYEFPYKAGRVDRRPPLVAPHMPRLDWQMWFAALNPRGNAYWLTSLAEQILEGNPQTAALMDCPEIADHPPQAVRFVYYDYEFSSPNERRETGAWWSRARMGELTGPLRSAKNHGN